MQSLTLDKLGPDDQSGSEEYEARVREAMGRAATDLGAAMTWHLVALK